MKEAELLFTRKSVGTGGRTTWHKVGTAVWDSDDVGTEKLWALCEEKIDLEEAYATDWIWNTWIPEPKGPVARRTHSC